MTERDDPRTPGGRGAVGTVAEEAARLFESLTGRPLDPATFAPPDADPDGSRCPHPRAGEATTCALCPVCQGIAWLRTVNPETIDRLADLAAAATSALRDLATRASEQADPPPRPATRVEDIDVTDDEEADAT